MKDIKDADIVFIGIFTYAAVRGYKIASYLRKHTNATVVLGGLHASMNYKEAVSIVVQLSRQKSKTFIMN